jgi:hypothetical protein
MGAVEHLKTLCCLGLPPESAMIAVTPLLHEIIAHGWSRMGLYESDAAMGSSVYAENPAMAFYLERFWGFLNDPSDIMGSLYLPNLGPPESAGLCIGKGGVTWMAPGIAK